MKAPSKAVTIEMIFPPSEMCLAASFRIKKAALELILPTVALAILTYLLIGRWRDGVGGHIRKH